MNNEDLNYFLIFGCVISVMLLMAGTFININYATGQINLKLDNLFSLQTLTAIILIIVFYFSVKFLDKRISYWKAYDTVVLP